MGYPLAVDVSNYTKPRPLTQETLAAWWDAGVRLVIVQAVNPSPPYPPTQTRQQLQACEDFGMLAHPYLWCWWNDSQLEILKRNEELLDGFNLPFRWLDLETAQGDGIAQTSISQRIELAMRMLEHLGGPERVGVYSAEWFFDGYLGSTMAFALAGYRTWSMEQGVADPTVFTPYAGWDRCAIKQYALDTELCGIRGIDLNVIEPDLVALAVPATTPDALAHLDAAWGHTIEAGKLTRSVRIRDHLEQARAELLLVKQEAGWE